MPGLRSRRRARPRRFRRVRLARTASIGSRKRAGDPARPVRGLDSPAIGDWTRAGTWVSNGAFRLVAHQVRGALRLERNVRHDTSASFSLDAVNYLPSNDVAMRVNRIRAGEIHVVGWPGFPPNRQQTLRRELPPHTVRVLPLGSVRYVDARVEGWIDNPQDVRLSCNLRFCSADADCPRAG